MRNAAIKAQSDALLADGKHRQALQVLRTIIADEPDCATAHHKLGLVHMRLQEFHEAEHHFLRAARLQPEHWSSFDGLAETYGHLNEREKARQAGCRALQLKDASVPSAMLPVPPVPPRPGGERIIAFSLFGAHPRYCETAVLNAAAVASVFPGWVCRFYADATVPPRVLERLWASGALIVPVEGTQQALPATMWRFLALDDPAASAVICRDADSLVNARDAGFVRAWLDSGRPFHIIRDYFSHTDLLLAGLFGVRGGVLSEVEDMMRRWLAGGGPAHRWTDQHFLRDCVWPWARDAALTHDAWFGFGRHVVADLPVAADPHDHVGANHGSLTMALRLDFPDGSEVHWTLVDAAGAAICGYGGTIHGGRHTIEIPRSYRAPIRACEWTVKWAVTPAK